MNILLESGKVVYVRAFPEHCWKECPYYDMTDGACYLFHINLKTGYNRNGKKGKKRCAECFDGEENYKRYGKLVE